MSVVLLLYRPFSQFHMYAYYIGERSGVRATTWRWWLHSAYRYYLTNDEDQRNDGLIWIKVQTSYHVMCTWHVHAKFNYLLTCKNKSQFRHADPHFIMIVVFIHLNFSICVCPIIIQSITYARWFRLSYYYKFSLQFKPVPYRNTLVIPQPISVNFTGDFQVPYSTSTFFHVVVQNIKGTVPL